MKTRSTAILLALLLGGIGIHKFYLEKPVQGILYLMFCWTFVPAFLGFFSAIAMCFSSDAAFNARYNRAA